MTPAPELAVATPDPAPVAAPGRRVLRGAAWLAGVAAVALFFILPVRGVTDPTLDNSNYASYAYFTAVGFHYGTEVVPMAGPYGFVPYGFLYAGKLFGKRLALELLTKCVLGALVVWFFHRAGGWLRWLWLAALVIGTPLVEDLPYDLAILMAGLCVLDTAGSGRRPWLGGLLAVFLALLTLFKGTQAMLALMVLGLLAGQAVIRRDFRPLAWIAAGYAGGLVVFLLLAGQNPLDFPLYLRGVLELSSGYNAAMMVEEPRTVFLTGGGAFLALEVMAAIVLWARRRNPALAAGTLLLAAYTFIQWKHGFVRGDGHVYIFYHYAITAALTLWLFAFPAGAAAPAPVIRALLAALGVAATALGIWGPADPVRFDWLVTAVPRQAWQAAGQIAAPAATKASLDAELDRRRVLYELPLVRRLVGGSSVDYFGTDHGYLTLNRLNYRPRPMSGGPFNVFTPWLHDVNVARLTDPATRPEYFLVRLETIDERFLAQDDAGTLRALLALYEPVATEQGMVLFRRIPGATIPAPRLLAEQTFAPGQEVAVPDAPPGQMLAVEMDLPLTLTGRLRGLLYKPPILSMDLQGEGIVNPKGRRVVPACFARPVLLNPVIEDVADLLDAAAPAPGRKIRSFRLESNQADLWQRSAWKVRFYAVPRPPPAPAVADLQARLRFPAATRLPQEMKPSNLPLRIFEGLRVQMLPAPGAIRFAVAPGDTGVRFVYGIDVAAYTVPNETDGVEFVVELERRGQPPQPLFRKMLHPAAEPADRPFQVQEVLLPPRSEDATLVLRTGAGPQNNEACDWAFYSGINIWSGAYRLAQFPGFNRAPDGLDAATCGAYTVDGRTLFMLNAPGAISFNLAGHETQLSFSAGMLPGAYTQGGQSDGVEFVVELTTADGKVTQLARHALNPGADESQRVDQGYTVPLPRTGPGARLTLKVTPGPDNNGAWDWSYLSNLDIR